jgi:hypothetical protein
MRKIYAGTVDDFNKFEANYGNVFKNKNKHTVILAEGKTDSNGNFENIEFLRFYYNIC